MKIFSYYYIFVIKLYWHQTVIFYIKYFVSIRINGICIKDTNHAILTR